MERLRKHKRTNIKWINIWMAVILGWLCAVPIANPADAALPAAVKVTQIAAAENNSIALKSDGTVIVWGTQVDGWAKPPAGLKDVVEVYAKDTILMARKSNGTVVVWGGNDAGETNVPPGLNRVISMAAAGNHTLTVRETSILPGAGEVIGWGLNGNGQSTIPDAAKSSVTKVAAGTYYSMALKYNGTVVDWGTNGSGATSMPAGLSGVVAIDAGYMYALALKSNGTVVAWGKEYNGNGIINVPAGLNDVVAISANREHALALKRNGTVVGWGDNRNGKATPPVGLNDVVAISAGVNHSLALKSDGTVVSWGSQTSVPGNNELIGLTVAEGAPSQTFSPSVTSYHYDIAPGVSSVHIKADLRDSTYSALYINDQLQPSGQTVAVTVPPTGAVIKVRVEPYMKAPKTYTLTVSRDREPPVIHFDPDGSAVPLRTITTAVQVTDATSGIDASTLEYVWSQLPSAPSGGWAGFSLLPATQLAQFTHTGADGNWYLHVRARDYAGNSASKTSAPFLIDNSPPVVSVTMKTEDDNAVYPENTWTGKNVVITAAATDSLSGIATFKYTLDGGKTWTDYSDLDPVTLTESGVHTIIFQASDAIGNVKLESRTVNISKGNFKLTPTMNKVNPDGSDGDAYKSGEWTNGSVKVRATAEALENGPPIIKWSLNGDPELNFGADATFFQSGMNTVVFRVIDSLDNSLSIPLAINIDKTPPTVAFSPDGNGTSARAASVTATVYDAGGSGLVNATLEYVWTQSNTTKPTDGWQLLSNGSELKKDGVDGEWYLHVQGKDAAGNEVHAVSERFVLDNSALNSTISPSTADFDKNTTAQTDIAITLSLNGNTLTGIRNGSEELVRNTDYTVLGNTVMISKSYLATQPIGTTSLIFSFNAGADQALTITVNDTTVIPDENSPIISSATISPKAVRYDLDFPGDISAKITWNSATSVTNVVYGHVLLATTADYSVSGDVLTIKDSYLAAQSFSEGDEVRFTIFFDQGNSAELTLDVVRNYTPGSNADLSILTVGGSRITDFAPDVLTYHVELPYGTLPGSMAATVGADADDRKAGVTITQAASLPGSATVQVTAEDEVTFKDYTISFTLADAAPTPGTGTGTGGGGGSVPTVTKPEIDLNGKPFDPTGIDTSKPSVTLEVEPRDGLAYASIPVSLLASFADQNASFIIEIKTPYGSYQIPVNLSSLIPGLKELLAKNNLTVEEVSFKISLTDKSGDAALQAALASKLPNGKALGAMVDYHLEIVNTKTGQAVGTADQFSQAITRIIPMPQNVTAMPEQWGAFRYNGTTKKFEFVPAKAVKLDGVWYALIRSYSNSTYVVAENAVSFADVQEKHWAKSYVELAAAKGLVEGVGGERYDPGKAVTRAEFTVMLVRALGRGGASANGSTASYSDVGAGTWYSSAVAKAKALGLLDFAKGGSFKPNQALTREEMASMLAAVIRLEQPTITSNGGSLGNYRDIGSLDTSDLENIRLVTKLQIMNGTSKTMFSPNGVTTRAQAAAVFVRTLQALGMID
ncbi:alpha-tubulin suppressor-like RCC1 family protein [Cohnella sp. SGD-V74]|uniref:X2-like carbohydrate binding domain-containing protein n=1 Tax=unclassified Cohnella TaxID=2636738 RepID=UPI000D4FF6F2|nr:MULTISPECIES: X2-like carbohydrate binding domain-containing protein [unclassified Cohnella]PRX71077.1 alpha-tubulin suppressor-like RCC1 family protein [Cohnella sp. SGD-V74]